MAMGKEFVVYDAENGDGWTFGASRRHYDTAVAAAIAATHEARILLGCVESQLQSAEIAEKGGIYFANAAPYRRTVRQFAEIGW